MPPACLSIWRPRAKIEQARDVKDCAMCTLAGWPRWLAGPPCPAFQSQRRSPSPWKVQCSSCDCHGRQAACSHLLYFPVPSSRWLSRMGPSVLASLAPNLRHRSHDRGSMSRPGRDDRTAALSDLHLGFRLRLFLSQVFAAPWHLAVVTCFSRFLSCDSGTVVTHSYVIIMTRSTCQIITRCHIHVKYIFKDPIHFITRTF